MPLWKDDDTGRAAPTDANEPFAGQWAITVDEWMRATRTSRSTTYRLIRDGKLDARKLGARTLITAASARAFLVSLQVAEIGHRTNRGR